MKKVLLSAIFLAAFLLIGIGSASADTYTGICNRYVDTVAGCGGKTPCYATIPLALKAVAAGDTVCVNPGTYKSGQIGISKNDIKLIGVQGASQTKIITNSNYGIYSISPGTVIDGFDVSTADYVPPVNTFVDPSGITINSYNGIVRNNIVHDITNGTPYCNGTLALGINAGGTASLSNNRIENNTIYHVYNGWSVVDAGGSVASYCASKGVNSTNNYFSVNGGRGIFSAGGSWTGPRAIGNVIKGNVISNIQGVRAEGITFKRSNDTIIENNEINLADNLMSIGIKSEGAATGSTIKNNQINDSLVGIQFETGISGNTLYGGTNNFVIKDNTISGSPAGYTDVAMIGGSVSGNEMCKNNWNNTAAVISVIADAYGTPKENTFPGAVAPNLPCTLPCVDADGDGYGVGDLAGCQNKSVDCNDNDATQYPGTTKVTDANLPWGNLGLCRVETSKCQADGTYSITQPKLIPAFDEDKTCDGKDEDCSGQNDEEYPSSETTCGIGACAATGTKSCTSGLEVDSCTPGTPVAETCDGIDNNCDGEIDNLDADNDGLNDCSADKCLGSTPDNIQLNPNQYAQNNLETSAFESGPKNDQSIVYNSENTKGCTCKQIVAELGLGEGQIKKGCAPGIMQQWTGINSDEDRKEGIGGKSAGLGAAIISFFSNLFSW